MRAFVRRHLPFALRVEIARLRGLPVRLLERRGLALEQPSEEACAEFGHLLAERVSPLRRGLGNDGAARATDSAEALQRGKEHNVARAAALLDRALIPPACTLSYGRMVGRPSRLRGFRVGLELHGEEPSAGVGGGCCQVSNLLYLLGAEGGLRITERHRHALDLFPDHQRTVPFGCGATVFYGLSDLRLENPLDQPVLLRMAVRDGFLTGRLLCREEPGFTVALREEGHRFFEQEGQWWRENRIRRVILGPAGEVLLDQVLAENRARVCYEPPEEPTC